MLASAMSLSVSPSPAAPALCARDSRRGGDTAPSPSSASLASGRWRTSTPAHQQCTPGKPALLRPLRGGSSSSSSSRRGRAPVATAPRAENGAGVGVKSKEREDDLAVTGGAAHGAPSSPSTPPSPSTGDEGSLLEGADSAAIGQGSAVLGVLVVALILGLAGAGYVFRDELNSAVEFFTRYIEEAGPLGYVEFLLGYAALEVLAVPAIPLTMSAGLLFGPAVGTALCSASATLAATVSFLIARYVVRDRILGLVQGNKKFLAIDKAVGEDSFRVVTLLRLSPLLPFSLGNYVYGLTSVRLVPYVFASWLGMLPGTWAYVSAGAFGRSLLAADESGVSPLSDSSVLALLAGLGVTVGAAAYVGNLAKNAIKDIE